MRSPAFAAELGRLCTGGTREEPLVFPRTCPAAYAFIVALAAAQSKEPRRIWAVADALPMQERVSAELPLWDTPCIFVPEREIHVNKPNRAVSVLSFDAILVKPRDAVARRGYRCATAG